MKAELFTRIARVVALGAATCLTIGSLRAQENITGDLFAGWAVNSQVNGGGSPPAALAPTSSDPNVIVGSLTKGAGIGAIATAGVYGGMSWTNSTMTNGNNTEAKAIASGLYLTYTVQAQPGYTISFTTNILFFHNSATGPINGELQYSTDGVNYTDIATMTYSATHAAQTTSLTNNLSGVAALQNVPSTTVNYFRIVNWNATGTAGTWYINNASPVTMPDLQIIGTISSAGIAPFNLSIAPSSISTNAGSTVGFTVTAQGDAPTYYWYKVAGGVTNLIPSATTSTLTLANVAGADAANYYVVLSNNTGMATSSEVSLSVTDPFITTQPVSTYGILNGTALFSTVAAGTSPAYKWFYSDTVGNVIGPVSDGTQPDNSVISGSGTGTLAISNLQLGDGTNFVCVASNVFGTATSSVASLLEVGSHEPMVFWNFNQLNFPNNIGSPAPWFGVGTAEAVGSCNNPGTSPFAGSVDPNDGLGFGLGTTNFSWGTSSYPASGSNKLNGVQFNLSTVGAQNITLSYDSRVSATASDYERVQYTIDGTTWIDYPSSSTFGGIGTTYLQYSNNFTGFPGVANNPNFGIRIVTEFQSTASYGVSTNAAYLGTANTYGTGGTVTYDRVTVYGDSIPGTYAPPTISSFANTNTSDIVPITVDFTVSDPNFSPDTLTYSAVALDPTFKVSPGFAFGGSGANRTLTITPNSTPDNVDAAPILVTVTDGNGFSAASSFILTLTSPNLPPTNSLVSLKSTNTVVNTPTTLALKATDDHTPTNGASFSYSASSLNNTVVPAGNIVVTPTTSSNATMTITPASYQLGIAQVGITVNDNDPLDSKSTTATVNYMVRPNTNIVLIDYFNYDNGGALDTAAAGVWNHLSGTTRQMQVSTFATGGFVTVDTLDNTENLQATLLGAPYSTNSSTVLYSSFIVNMDATRMPIGNGSYFALFNDGSGTTGPYECRVLAATNGAAPGYYRIGIVNFGADATDGQLFPMDLSPGSNYVVVTSLVLSNGISTVWVSPTSKSSPSVTDPSPSNGANLFNISAFELRESGGTAGSVKLSHLKVGTTFDSVFPALQIQPGTGQVVLFSSDPTIGIQSAPSLMGPFTDVSAHNPYTNAVSVGSSTFYRLGQ